MGHGSELIPQMSARRHDGMVFLGRDHTELALRRNVDASVRKADRPFSDISHEAGQVNIADKRRSWGLGSWAVEAKRYKVRWREWWR
jgi:hypothetical protein